MTLTELRAKRETILGLAASRGADRVRVFGSVARNTADERSDVDLLIDLRSPRPRGFRYFGLIADLEGDLTAALGRRVHVVDLPDPGAPEAQKILDEAIPL